MSSEDFDSNVNRYSRFRLQGALVTASSRYAELAAQTSGKLASDYRTEAVEARMLAMYLYGGEISFAGPFPQNARRDAELAVESGMKEIGSDVPQPLAKKLLEFAGMIARMHDEQESEEGIDFGTACIVLDLIRDARKITGVNPGHPKVWCRDCGPIEGCECGGYAAADDKLTAMQEEE